MNNKCYLLTVENTTYCGREFFFCANLKTVRETLWEEQRWIFDDEPQHLEICTFGEGLEYITGEIGENLEEFDELMADLPAHEFDNLPDGIYRYCEKCDIVYIDEEKCKKCEKELLYCFEDDEPEVKLWLERMRE